MCRKDAIFISTHKFVGGPSCPGILVVKKKLVTNNIPTVPGGGTVFFVTSDRHRYLENLEEREEGGTQNILGIIRSGLVFQLKRSVGVASIETREQAIISRVLASWSTNRNIVLLGDLAAPRVPVCGV